MPVYSPKDIKRKFCRIFWNFLNFFGFCCFFVIVTNVTTKSYQGYYWGPKNAQNGPKQYKKLFFCPKGKKSLGRSPPQELEVSPRSGLYLLVFFQKLYYFFKIFIFFYIFASPCMPGFSEMQFDWFLEGESIRYFSFWNWLSVWSRVNIFLWFSLNRPLDQLSL